VKASRIAVVRFNDNNIETVLSFTDQSSLEERKSAAIAAINSLSLGGNGTELHNTALLRALDGRSGQWRQEATARRIFLITDEPGDDNDLRPQVLTLAANVAAQGSSAKIPVEISPVLVDGLHPGSFKAFANAAGGQIFEAVNFSEVVDDLIASLQSPLEGSPVVALSNSIVAENSASGVVIGELTVTGGNTNGNYNFELLNNAGGSFILDGNKLVVAEGAVLNFETTATLDLLINISGSGFAAFNQTLTVALNNLNDTIENRINGTNQNDTLTGTSDISIQDFLHGLDGDDILNGLQGSDFLIGDNGNDNLFGGDGNDHLSGNLGADYLDGGTGDDTLNAGTGFDIVNGGLGNDLLIVDYSIGEISPGNIVTYISDNGAGVHAGNYRVFAGFYNGNSPVNSSVITFSNIERFQITGTADWDMITTGSGNDILNGGMGNDTLDGRSGNDTIFGGEGSDSIIGGVGNDSINGSEGNDTINGENGNDIVDGGLNNDAIYGGAGDDTIRDLRRNRVPVSMGD
jgi:Ca2+-binding RTX toxin-like protein